MPVVGDRASRMGEAAVNSVQAFLTGLQAGDHHQLMQARVKAFADEAQDREQAKQAQGDVLAMGEEQRGKTAFQGVQRHMKKAADFLGLPVVPGQEEAAAFVNGKIRERVENIRRIGSGMSERAYLLFRDDQVRQIEADAMELRARYVLKDIQKAMTMDLGPGAAGDVPGMDMIRSQVEETVAAYRSGQATGRDVMRALKEARSDAAELTAAFYKRAADMNDLNGLAMPFQGTPLHGEAMTYVAQYERGARSLVSAEDAIMRLRRGKTGEPTRQELVMDAHKMAKDRADLGEDYGQAFQASMQALTGEQPAQQQADPQAIAQAIREGRYSEAQLAQMERTLPPQIVAQIAGMVEEQPEAKSEAPPEPGAQASPEEPEPYRKPSAVGSMAQAVARPIVEGMQSEVIDPMVGEMQKKAAKAAPVVQHAASEVNRIIGKAGDLLGKFESGVPGGKAMAKAIQEQKLRESLEEVRSVIASLQAKKPSAERNKKLKEARGRAKALAAAIAVARGG